jgi:hypothetical protein
MHTYFYENTCESTNGFSKICAFSVMVQFMNVKNSYTVTEQIEHTNFNLKTRLLTDGPYE